MHFHYHTPGICYRFLHGLDQLSLLRPVGSATLQALLSISLKVVIVRVHVHSEQSTYALAIL